MKYSKFVFASALIASVTITSCSNDNDDQATSYTVPTNYSFERNGATTVEFSGQTNRILMLEELGNVIKTAATNGTVADLTVLQNMYTNTNNPFSEAFLNTSGKQLKNKTAASTDYFELNLGGGSITERNAVLASFESQLLLSNQASQGPNASAGVAGVYLDGSSSRLFAPNGLEPQQVLLKGMMGAVFLDQIVNNYLSVNKLDEASNRLNNSNKIVATGQSYTTMEHAWDEAYGYVYGADNVSGITAAKFWSSYINQVDADADFNTLKSDIELAFRTGRAAIIANDYTTRDAQIDIIKSKLALVPAVRAVYYLQDGKAKLVTDNGAKAFHALSEAYGFIISLRYTNKPGTNSPYFSKTEVDAMLASMVSGNNGLWDIDTLGAKLDTISTQIATKFGFTVAQAATVN